jgi:DNA primase
LNDEWVALKQKVKEASDIVAIVGGYIPLRQVGPTFKGLCPFHADQRPSFDVDPRRQRYRCWACAKFGDVINFVQEFERVSFQEAMELLARKAGISLEKTQRQTQGPSRAAMLDVTKWAAEQFQQCLLDSPHAEKARVYLGQRRLTGETVRRFGLGFAPAMGEWLVQKAANDHKPAELLETVGLIGRRNEGRGFYDRFRDRVMFPIRDPQGRVVGFGGRVLPDSPIAERGPKYYNSTETPLFSKSEQLYGIDLARDAVAKAGYLAIVEGYTDVMMAHQCGVPQVVATMGTALTPRHLQKLRHFAPRVVLVYDADEGGDRGVDKALEVFVSHDIDLRIASLPDGLDPCDLMVAQGGEPFRKALESAIDVFDYKLARVWTKHGSQGLEGQRLAVEEMLGVLAQTPDERSVKLELMVNRIAHRLQIKEETVWARLRELRVRRKKNERGDSRPAEEPRPTPPPEMPRTAKAARHEVELLEYLLAEPALVDVAIDEIPVDEVEHPGLRLLLAGLYALHAEGVRTDLDHLQARLDNERLMEKARDLQDRGLDHDERKANFPKVLQRFQDRRAKRRQEEIKNQVLAASDDPRAALAIWQRQLKNQQDQ